MNEMESTKAKSNNILQICIIVLLLVPILWGLGERVYENELFQNKEYVYWYIFRTIISTSLIFLVYKKMYGILLFLIIKTAYQLLYSIQYYIFFPDKLETSDILFNILSLSALILMIVLLKREDQRFFNLRFRSSAVAFLKTSRLIFVFNLLYILLFVAAYSVLLVLIGAPLERLFELKNLIHMILSPDFAFTVILIITTIIGYTKTSKFQNLAFAISMSCMMSIFFLYMNYSLFPFTESWNDQNWYLIIIGIAFDAVMVGFGILLFFIVRSYLREKNLNDGINLSNSETLDI